MRIWRYSSTRINRKKRILRFVVIFLILTWSFSASAFWPVDTFIRTERKINIQIAADLIHVQIDSTVQNKTENSAEFSYWTALPENVTTVSLYQDFDALNFSKKPTQASIDLIWNEAKKQNSADFLSLLSPQFTSIISSDLVLFAPGEEKSFSLQFVISNEKSESAFQIFLQDGLRDEKFSAEISGASSQIEQILTNLPATQRLILDNQLILRSGSKNFLSNENLHAVWAGTNQKISGKSGREYFSAEFLPLPAPSSPKKIAVWVDRSGSMLGTKWERAKDTVKLLLKNFPESSEIRFGWFDETLHFDEPALNDFEFQKDFIQRLENLKPVGKTNFQNILKSEIPDVDQLFLITDEEMTEISADFENLSRPLVLVGVEERNTPSTYLFGGIPVPMTVFHFGQSDDLKFLAERSGGQYQSLFKANSQLIQSEEIEQRIAALRKPFQADDAEKFPRKRSHFPLADSLTTVQRNFVADEGLAEISWLKQFWARYKLADIFGKIIDSAEISDEHVAALLSVGRRYGVSTAWFSAETSFSDLSKTLRSVGLADFFRERIRLEKNDFAQANPNTRSIQGVPFYFNASKSLWQSWDWYDRVTGENLLEIAPFSEAQQFLLQKFPRKFSEIFALGLVDACVDHWCFSITKSGRAEARLSDQLLFHEKIQNHWVRDFWLQAVDENIFSADFLEKTLPNDRIDRGKFSDILVRRLELGQIPDYEVVLEQNFFTDLPRENPYFAAVTILKHFGILQGYEDKTARIGQLLSRAEAVKLILAASGFVPIESEFSAENFIDTPGWENPWANEAFQRKMVQGYETEQGRAFRPNAELTAAEAVKMLMTAE